MRRPPMLLRCGHFWQLGGMPPCDLSCVLIIYFVTFLIVMECKIKVVGSDIALLIFAFMGLSMSSHGGNIYCHHGSVGGALFACESEVPPWFCWRCHCVCQSCYHDSVWQYIGNIYCHHDSVWQYRQYLLPLRMQEVPPWFCWRCLCVCLRCHQILLVVSHGSDFGVCYTLGMGVSLGDCFVAGDCFKGLYYA
jgi:hypothetical protein